MGNLMSSPIERVSGAGNGVAKILSPSFQTMSFAEKEIYINKVIKEHTPGILIFSKSWCPYAAKGKKCLLACGVNHSVIELDLLGENRGGDVQQILNKLTGISTVPNVFISVSNQIKYIYSKQYIHTLAYTHISI